MTDVFIQSRIPDRIFDALQMETGIEVDWVNFMLISSAVQMTT